MISFHLINKKIIIIKIKFMREYLSHFLEFETGGYIYMPSLKF